MDHDYPVTKNPYKEAYTRGANRTTHHTRCSRDVRNGTTVNVCTESAYHRHSLPRTSKHYNYTFEVSSYHRT